MVGVAEINWGTIGSMLLATAMGSFAALWAQGAPVNRGMRSALYATLGFVAALLLLVASVGLVYPATRINPIAWTIAGLAVGLPLWPGLRRLLSHVIPIDPASLTHAVALIAVGLTLLLGVAVFLAPAGQSPLADQPASAAEIIAQHLGALILALFSVGLYLRRSWPAALARLGLTKLSPVAAAGSLLVGLGAAAAHWLLRVVDPGVLSHPDRITALLSGQRDQLWLGGLVAVVMAIGLEVLFRGALQPRLGIPLTALTFAAANILFAALGPLLLLIGLGLALGLWRQRVGTTGTILALAIYGLSVLATAPSL